MWADTSQIGCAATYYTTKRGDKDKWHNIVLVCNYAPGGNYVGLPIYESGNPASKCPDGLKRNKHYEGLCGQGKRVAQVKNIDLFGF